MTGGARFDSRLRDFFIFLRDGRRDARRDWGREGRRELLRARPPAQQLAQNVFANRRLQRFGSFSGHASCRVSRFFRANGAQNERKK